MTVAHRDRVKQLEADYSALSKDLTKLQALEAEAREKAEAARKASRPLGEIKQLAGEYGGLMAIVKAQAEDVEATRAELRAAKFEATRAELIENLRPVAAGITEAREEMTAAIHAIVLAATPPAARLAAAGRAWRKLFEQYVEAVAQLATLTADESGEAPPARSTALADAKAWLAITPLLEAADINAQAFEEHPDGNDWTRETHLRSGYSPSFAPRLFEVPLPDLATVLSRPAWDASRAPRLAQGVVSAVLQGVLKDTSAAVPDPATAGTPGV